MTGSTRWAVVFLAVLMGLTGVALAQTPRMLADVNPGSASSLPAAFVTMGGRVYFLARVGNQAALIAADGVEGTTQIWAGPPGVRGGAIAALDDRLLFLAMLPGRPSDVLYTSDGTPEGTVQLAVPTGLAPWPESVFRWARVGDTLIVRSTFQGAFGSVWRTDGTAAGTFQISASQTGWSSSYFDAPALLAMNGAAYFITAGSTVRLNRTDGTVAGTTVIDEGHTPSIGPTRLLGVADGRLYYRRVESGHIDIRSTDGAPGGNALAAEFGPESWAGQVTVFRDRLCFVMFTGMEYLLMSTDGTPEGTIQLSPPGAQIHPGIPLVAAPPPFDRLFFAVSTSPFSFPTGMGTGELWTTDGTPQGAQPLGLSFRPQTQPIPLGVVRDRVYFAGATAASGYELFVTDGTRQGTRQLGETIPGPTGGLGMGPATISNTLAAPQFLFTDQFVYFRATDGIHGVEPWVVATCPADFNSDGHRDPDDLADFITLFFLPDPPPQLDMVGDGQINPDDLAEFITVFFQGCP